jgi:chorismate-pyruvate lyase
VRLLLGVALVLLSGAAGAQTIPDTALARIEALALLQTLNADLLSHDSATLTLERWCGSHHLAADARVHAERVRGQDKEADAALRRDLAVTADEPVRYRRVRLSCGDKVLSEADNWYVPSRLTPEMNRLLDETDTPFGRAVRDLGFARHTLGAELLWQPLPPGWEASPLPADGKGEVPIPQELLRHSAMLTTRTGMPFSRVVETYQRAMLAFPLPER